MSRSSLRFAAIVAGCCLTAGLAFANSHDNKDAKGAADMEAMMKLAAPGAPHEMLKKSVGTWKTSVKSYMAPGEPMTTEGQSELKMTLGDRYLEEIATGDMGGMQFEGHGVTGYDNAKKMYVFSWVDNMGTGIMNGTGTYDEAKKLLTMKSTGTGMDGKPATFRSTMTFPDDNTRVFTMYMAEKGKEKKMMEMTYTRQ